MREKQLKLAFDHLNIKPEMETEILEYVEQMEKFQKKRTLPHYWQRIAAIFMGALLVGSLLSIPVKAFVHAFVQERMEQLSKEEVSAIATTIQEQAISADSMIREYTLEENTRMTELAKAYNQGMFPTGAITEVATKSEAEGLEFCYITQTGEFYLPSRSLTDEELLEIIDFNIKRDYALSCANKEIMEEQQELNTQREQVITKQGGITEEESVDKATLYMEMIYGKSTTGYELNHYVFDLEADPVESYFSFEVSKFYDVNFSVIHDYYYLYIDPADGSLLQADHSYVKGQNLDPLTQEDLFDTVNTLYQSGKELIEKLHPENVEYSDIYYKYCLDENGYVYGNSVAGIAVKNMELIFTQENGCEEILTYDVRDGELLEYKIVRDKTFIEEKSENELGYPYIIKKIDEK